LSELTSSNLSNNAKHITIKRKSVDFKALSVKYVAKGLTPLDTVNNLVYTALKYDKTIRLLVISWPTPKMKVNVHRWRLSVT